MVPIILLCTLKCNYVVFNIRVSAFNFGQSSDFIRYTAGEVLVLLTKIIL